MGCLYQCCNVGMGPICSQDVFVFDALHDAQSRPCTQSHARRCSCCDCLVEHHRTEGVRKAMTRLSGGRGPWETPAISELSRNPTAARAAPEAEGLGATKIAFGGRLALQPAQNFVKTACVSTSPQVEMINLEMVGKGVSS